MDLKSWEKCPRAWKNSLLPQQSGSLGSSLRWAAVFSREARGRVEKSVMSGAREPVSPGVITYSPCDLEQVWSLLGA